MEDSTRSRILDLVRDHHGAIRTSDVQAAGIRNVYLSELVSGGVRYELGIAAEEIEGHTIRIYDREKTICDAIRYRKLIGDDAACESARNYMARKDRSVDRLLDYAERLRMLPTVERMVRAYRQRTSKHQSGIDSSNVPKPSRCLRSGY